MIPDNVEKIIMTKEDYDRNVEQLLLEKINAEQEIERLNNDIKILLKENENKEKVILKYDNIINNLEKSWKEEITRFNNFIQEDSSMIEINNIRKMLIQERENDLYKLQELKGSNK